jgi:hypothetical protein
MLTTRTTLSYIALPRQVMRFRSTNAGTKQALERFT